MATVPHNTLTTTDLHEPKGAAGASEGMVYVADGAGSGTWTLTYSGWGNYADDATAQTFNTTPAKLSIDGAGSTTEESYLPLAIRGSGSLWDNINDKITPIAVGDAYEIRVDLPITSITTATYLEFDLDIGGLSSPSNVIASENKALDRSGAPFTISLSMTLFSLGTFKDNGCQIFLNVDAGSIEVTKPSIVITRVHGEVT